MRCNPEGIALIKKWEGCKLTAYKCPAGKWTIGYGCTGPTIKEGMTLSQEACELMLMAKLTEVERYVSSYLKLEATPNEFSAMVSLAYNVGPEKFRKSTLLRAFNTGLRDAAANEFMKWVYVGQNRSLGLKKRRAEERELFLKV